MTSGSWTRPERQVFLSTRPPDRNRRDRHRARYRLWLADPRLGRLRRSLRLVRDVVDAGLSPNPRAEAPYHPNAADMAAVAKLVLAALTADHRETSA